MSERANPEEYERVVLDDELEETVADACDVCGAPGGRLAVSQTRWGVVVPGKPTGYEEAGVACAEHYDAVVAALSEHVRATLDEQVPHHRAIHAKQAERELHARAVGDTARAVMRAHEEAVAFARGKRLPSGEAFPIAEPGPEVVEPHRVAVEAMERAEQERRELLAAATAAHDARLAAHRVSLRQT